MPGIFDDHDVLPAFRDTWVPAAAACMSPLKMTIDA